MLKPNALDREADGTADRAAALGSAAWHLANSTKAVGTQTDHQARPQIDHPIKLQRPIQQRIDCVERYDAQYHEATQAGCRKSGICDDPVRASHSRSKVRARRQGNQSGAAQNRDNAQRSLNVTPHFINTILAQKISRFISQIFFKSGQTQRSKQYKQHGKNYPPQRFSVYTIQAAASEKCLSAQSSDQHIYGGGKKAKKALVIQHICPSHRYLSEIRSLLSDHASLIKRLKRRVASLDSQPVWPVMIWSAAMKIVADLRSIRATPMHKSISIQGVLLS